MNSQKPSQFPPGFHTLLLVLIALISLGSNYERHALAGISPSIMEKLQINRTQFGMVLSSQDIPGIVLPAVTGLALIYLPQGPTSVFLSFGVLASTILGIFAIYSSSYDSLAFARLIFGFSDVALNTLQGALVYRWFKGRFGSSFGITMLVSRLSIFLGLSLPAFVCDRFGLIIAMLFSVIICSPSFFATIIYSFISNSVSSSYSTEETETSNLLGDTQNRIMEEDEDVERRGGFSLRGVLSIISSYPISFWVLCYVWASIGGPMFSVLDFAPDAFSNHFTKTQCGLITGSVMLISGLTSPAFGMLQDRVGKRGTILVTACTTFSLGIFLWVYALGEYNSLLLVTRKQAMVLGALLIAVSFSAVSVTMVASIGLIVRPVAAPLALGLHIVTQNAFLAVSHTSVGALRDYTGSYQITFSAMAVLALTGIVGSAYMGANVPQLGIGYETKKRADHAEMA